MLQLHEDDLIKGLQSKCQKTFSVLYDNYAGALYGIIMRSLKTKEESEDCLQEVFVKIWNSIDSYENSRGRLFTWMAAITRNHIIDVQRSKSFAKKQKVVTNEFAVYKMAEPVASEKYDMIGIAKYMLRLSPHHKNILQLAYLSGYTHTAISTMMNMPMGTVKTHMRKALYTLRTALE